MCNPHDESEPPISSTYTWRDLVAFLDRSNIGNAETAGMSEDVGFDDGQYQVSEQHIYDTYTISVSPSVWYPADPKHSGS